VRRLLFTLAGLFIVLLIALVVASWFGSSVLINPHRDLIKRNVRVVSVSAGQIVLTRTTQSARPGVYGLDFPAGHAIAGTVLASTASTVTRRLTSLAGRLGPGSQVGIDADVWNGDPRTALGIPYRAITFPDPLGPMPAWLITGRGSTWVIFVHGIDGTRAGGLRPLGELHRLGLPSLLIAYRNDPGAPRSPDGHIHLGMTEWQDLDAAARWAVSRGAQHLILYGDSMGGSIVTRFMHLSQLAPKVAGLVLDAPVLDWAGVIDHVASRLHLPFMGPPVRWMIQLRIDVNWDALDELAQAGKFRLPILLFQGLDDPLVPPADSHQFAQAAPGPVTYVPVAGAAHIESWNANPASYDAWLRRFLAPWAG
jgi:alpha-beta hydrolase superfamily lysophospholipase